jgi:hypothetical protein
MRTNGTSTSPRSHDTTRHTRHGNRRPGRTRTVLATLSVGSLVGTALLASMVSAAPAGAATATAIPAGFASASTTGVPAGTTLRNVPGQVSSGPGWTWNKAGQYVEVTGNGATLSGLRIPGTVDVSASNVTLKDLSITPLGGGNAMGVDLRHTANVTVENCSIQGTNATTGRILQGVKDVYGDATGTQVLDNNIQKAATGVQIFQGTIEGNYIHNLGLISGDHVNGITTNGDTQPLLIQDNTVLNRYDQTDAIGLFQDFGVVSNVTINHNYLAGGGYTIYGGQGSEGPSSNIVITNNVFSSQYFKQSGEWGPVSYFDSQGAGNVWSGNTWASSGQTVPAS